MKSYRQGFHPMFLATAIFVTLSAAVSGCNTSLSKPTNDPIDDGDPTVACTSPADIEWTGYGAAGVYVADDDHLGYGEYPEGPTASQGSACRVVVAPAACEGETIHILNTRVMYGSDPNIIGNGNARKAALIFGGDTVLVSQFTAAGSGSEGQTSALNGDREVPASVTVISQYPLSAPPDDAAAGEQACQTYARAFFTLE